MKKIDYFIQQYLENRPLFHAFMRPQEAMLFARYQKYLKSPRLDFGCGDGFFVKTAFGKQTIDIGLDLFDGRAKEAEKEKIYQKIIYYDGEKIPFPDNYFGSIISNCVLEHIPNLNQSLREIYRILKPDGYFLTTVMTDKWEEYLFGKKILGNIYIQWMRKIQQHYHLLTIKQWNNQFIITNFSIVKNVGYLSKKTTQFNELFHYLSFPSFISYKLFGCWVLWPNMFNSPIIINAIKKNVSTPVKISQSAAIFFVLQKSSPLGGRRR